MTHGRVLAVHDISCVGRCSLTVALPIISSLGIECSVLPTAVLSTHTGGFKGFTYRDLTEDIVPIQDHWRSLGLSFDAFYTGFLGSIDQIELVKGLIDDLSNEKTTVYVDPVMADNGTLYTVFDEDFPKEMRKLCEKADVLTPNLTELCFMLGMDYTVGPYTWEYIESIFDAAEVFGLKKIAITGVSLELGKIGTVFKDYETGETGKVMKDMVEGYYHGTGDVFGSALVGALESKLSLKDAVKVAVDFTVRAIERTYTSDADFRYGVDFEEGLQEYIRQVRFLSRPLEFQPAESKMEITRVAGLAARIWEEFFDDLLPLGQTEYMVNKFQSLEAITEAVSEGYSYYIIKSDCEDIGYTGFRIEEDSIFLSKIYLDQYYRGFGIGSTILEFIMGVARKEGIHRLYLTVFRNNVSAIQSYQRMGFVIKESIDKPIGDGFEMNDYVMELTF